MAKEFDHQSDTDDKQESCTLKSAEGDAGCSNRDEQSQPVPLCNTGCPCKLTES